MNEAWGSSASDDLAKVQAKVMRLEARVRDAEQKATRSQKEAAKWKTRYLELEGMQNKEVISVDSEEDDEHGNSEANATANKASVLENATADELSDTDPKGVMTTAANGSRKGAEFELKPTYRNAAPSEEPQERKPSAVSSGKITRNSSADDDDGVGGRDRKRSRATDGETSDRSPRNKRSECKERVDEEASLEAETATAARSTRSAFNSLDREMQDWVAAIGLQDGYGTRYHGLEKLEIACAKQYKEPASFEMVFRLVDFLFPVESYEASFHHRLFKCSSKQRPGNSVRQGLRKMKLAKPHDPLVCWHQKGGEWIPPNADALTSMVRYIVDFRRRPLL